MELTYEDFFLFESKSIHRRIMARLYRIGKKLDRPSKVGNAVSRLGSLVTRDSVRLVKSSIKDAHNSLKNRDKVGALYHTLKINLGSAGALYGASTYLAGKTFSIGKRALGKALKTPVKIHYITKKIKRKIQGIKQKLKTVSSKIKIKNQTKEVKTL